MSFRQAFLTGMIERRRETFEQADFSTTVFKRERDTLSSPEIRGEYFQSLFLTATVRHDQNSTTEDFTTWHVSGSYLVPGNVFRVHASAGTGVKFPMSSFGDLPGSSSLRPIPTCCPRSRSATTSASRSSCWAAVPSST